MPAQTPIAGSFIWTLEDMSTRQAVLIGAPMTARGKFISYSITVFLIMMTFILVVVATGKSLRSFFADPFLVSIPFLTFIIILIFIYSNNANLKKSFLKSPDHDKRVDVTVSQDEIIMRIEGISENKWNWNTIKEVQRNPKGFCFFIAEKSGFWIPIRAFSSPADIEAMTQLIKQLIREKPSLKYKHWV